MLKVERLVKRYGDRVAVDGVSFSVERGQTIGLLGPNGAGKTTTLSMVSGMTAPDSGSVSVGGVSLASDPDGVKRKIGLVPQDVALYDEVSARNNLQVFGALYGLHGQALTRAIDDALALVGLADRATDKVKAFSGGMKRRLNIAAALLHDPELILLDEPTVGVDPQSRNAIFDNLAELRRRGKTIVYTTHYMEEAERLCDRIVIIDHGRVLADDTLAELLARAQAASRLLIDVEPLPSADAIVALRAVEGVGSVEVDGGQIAINVADVTTTIARVLTVAAALGMNVRGVASERAGLESVFLSLTGRRLRDA